MANAIQELIKLRRENKLLCDYGGYGILCSLVRIDVKTWDLIVETVDSLSKIQDILCPE